MNMRTFAVVFGAVAAASLAAANFTACTVTGSGSGGGGIGGGPASTSSSTSGSTSSTASSTGSGMCDMKLTCASAITPPGDPTQFCAGTASQMLYMAFHDCACTTGC